MILRVHTMLKKAIACSLLIAGISAQSAAPALAANDEIVVPIHRSELITLNSDIREVIVANPEVADVFVHGTNKVSVIGKTIGATNLRVLNKQNNVIRSVNIRVSYDLPGIRQTLHQLFPYEDIAVQPVNNNLALTGMVSSAAVASKAVRIVNEFLMPLDEERPRGAGFNLANNMGTTNGDTGVINMLKITSGQQVLLRVRVGEMQRTALKQLGINWRAVNADSLTSATGLLIGAAAGVFPVRDESFGALAGTVNTGGTSITAMIDALERNNLFKLLAEPNLVAMSGEEAEFLAGGEFPIPVQAQDEQVTIEFKEFGVAVKFLPKVLSESRIRVSVAPEISELSDIGSININGFQIPSLSTRRAKTTVELAPGESFMIAGLLRDQSETTIEQLPGIGEIPVLGALFRSTDFRRDETELVIAVTPYLVDPLTGDEVRLPTDGFRQSSMMEQFFYGALAAMDEKSLRTSQTPSLEGPIGFMVD
ncbi:MAG: type II and III secretion system protein family protein [Alphaproteobacteria bacterium]|nr:type II and III secretion system protein family protein [Alphaproteobacteria bacterium]